MLRATDIVSKWDGPFTDEVVLDHQDRHRRRIVLEGLKGTRFLIDFSRAPDVRDGDGIRPSSGTVVRVRAADEALMEIRCNDGLDLARIAWHIGNRHLAAEIGRHTIRLRADHVIADMVRGLGGRVEFLSAPFNPEGGAYDSSAPAGHHVHDFDDG